MAQSESENRQNSDGTELFRLMDQPMHYFAAIRSQNFTNLTRALAGIGISPYEWRVLAVLNENNRRTVNEIASIAVIERSTVSRVVARMAKQGLLLREAANIDRRRAQIQMTEEGRAKFREAMPIAVKLYECNLEGVSEKEKKMLMKVLRKIKDNVFRLESFG